MYIRLEKLAVSAALPLQAGCPTFVLAITRDRLRAHNAPAYQISAKSDNAWLCHWWFNKFPLPIFGLSLSG